MKNLIAGVQVKIFDNMMALDLLWRQTPQTTLRMNGSKEATFFEEFLGRDLKVDFLQKLICQKAYIYTEYGIYSLRINIPNAGIILLIPPNIQCFSWMVKYIATNFHWEAKTMYGDGLGITLKKLEFLCTTSEQVEKKVQKIINQKREEIDTMYKQTMDFLNDF